MCSCEEYEKAALLIEDKEGEVLAKLIWSCFEKQLEDGRPHPCSEVIWEIGKTLGIAEVDGIELLQALKPLVTGSKSCYEIQDKHFVRIDPIRIRWRNLQQMTDELENVRKQACALQSQMTDIYEYGARVFPEYEADFLAMHRRAWEHMDNSVEDIGTCLLEVEKHADVCLKRITIG